MARLMNQYFGPKVYAEKAQARAYDELLQAAIAEKADLYIGHNLGALAVVVNAAKANRVKAGFDFEDYHRGESWPNDWNTLRTIYLERKYINYLEYYSASSPFIMEKLKFDHTSFTGKSLTVLNCFPLKLNLRSTRTDKIDENLKIIWFGQTIGKNRGLENVIAALKNLNDPSITLTLIGRCESHMREYIINELGNCMKVDFKGVVAPEVIFKIVAKHDIGLATETKQPLNRDLCLTNKLFVYLICGVAIIASDTKAQARFLNDYPKIGKLFKSEDVYSLASAITYFNLDRSSLSSFKKGSRDIASQQLNWEVESKKFTDMIDTLMS